MLSVSYCGAQKGSSSSFPPVYRICWSPHSGSGRPAWITQQAAVAPLRRAQKAERGGKKTLCAVTTKKITSSSTTLCSTTTTKNQCLLNKIVIYSRRNCAGRQTSAATNPARLKEMNMQSCFKKASRQCINTKPGASFRANASIASLRLSIKKMRRSDIQMCHICTGVASAITNKIC